MAKDIADAAKEIWKAKNKPKSKRDPKITDERWKKNKNNGDSKCDNCDKPVKRGGQSQSGEKPIPDRGVVDHIEELQDVGDVIENTQILCDPCHADKTQEEKTKRKKK
ncbi:MAG: HNH endonuclease [Psychrosphaera sp.]|nr:HNH endonuclease [Psychrosphaera sp.]